MPTIINEGQLRFTFPDNWSVVKYDDTLFYRDQIVPTAANLKAVDILVVPDSDTNKIVMLEIKDFREHAKENEDRIVSGELVVEVIEKTLHTLAALYLVKYRGNDELSGFVGEELTPPDNIEVILFMEEDVVHLRHPNDTKNKLRKQNKEKRIADMELSLRQKLKQTARIKSRVLNTERLEARNGFTVHHL